MGSIEDFNVFIAQGKSLELAQAHFAKRKAAHEARKKHAKRTGGPKAVPYGDDFTYMGIMSPTPPDPKLWKPTPKHRRTPADAKHPCYVPNTQTKEGKALGDETRLGIVASASGGSLEQVPTRTTFLSSRCLCGKRAKKELKERKHTCDCEFIPTGMHADRDEFSAFLAFHCQGGVLDEQAARKSWLAWGAECLLRSSSNSKEAANREALPSLRGQRPRRSGLISNGSEQRREAGGGKTRTGERREGFIPLKARQPRMEPEAPMSRSDSFGPPRLQTWGAVRNHQVRSAPTSSSGTPITRRTAMPTKTWSQVRQQVNPSPVSPS